MIEETIRSLQERYPEDLNSIYNCYWWVTQGLYKEGDVIKVKSEPTYWLLLKNKYEVTDVSTTDEMNQMTNSAMKAHSNDPEKLVNLLDMYLQTCL